jgi:hypothetical protein
MINHVAGLILLRIGFIDSLHNSLVLLNCFIYVSALVISLFINFGLTLMLIFGHCHFFFLFN